MEKFPRNNNPMNVKSIRRENLRALAQSVGGISRLADRLNKSQSQLSHLIGQRFIKNIGDKIATEVENAFNKSPGWLDHPQQLIEKKFLPYSLEPNGERSTLCQQVPLISWEEATQWDTLAYLYQPTKHTPMIPTSTPHLGPFAFALRVCGDYMESLTGISFFEGAIVIADPDSRALPDSFVIARINQDRGATLKQLFLQGNKRYLKPLNRRYPILEFTITTIILGVVKQLIFNLSQPNKNFPRDFHAQEEHLIQRTALNVLSSCD